VEALNLVVTRFRERGKTQFRRPLFVVLLAIASFFSATSHLSAQPQLIRPTEAQVKAAYLFNFGKFVRWPSLPHQHNDSLAICVLGKNPFGSVLDATVEGETIDGKSVVARNIPTLQEAAGCQILFVSASEEGRLAAVLAGARQLRALTVSDIPRFAERGGMIELVTQGERIRFVANVGPMAEQGITVSSELLKVAVKVIGKSAGEN